MMKRKHCSLISARAGLLGGKFKGSLRVYTLGEGPDADVCFSLRLWHAAALRQRRLAGQAAYAQ